MERGKGQSPCASLSSHQHHPGEALKDWPRAAGLQRTTLECPRTFYTDVDRSWLLAEWH
jgi:hypothetical protein